MEYIFIICICVFTIIILKFSWSIKIKDIKRLKKLGYDKSLNEITNKLPENKEICKDILKMLNNKTVKIEESKSNQASLYIIFSNSIIIANIKNTFTRVQTVAHECLHSIQNKRTLFFNFIFSNIYFIYFVVICILTILKINLFPRAALFALVIFSFINYIIRSYLEMDAMIKAKPLAEQYLKKQKNLTEKEQEIILKNYDEINNIGIKLYNYTLIIKNIIKIIIYLIICIFFI